LRLLTSGGSALAPELGWKLEGFGWDVGIGYGLTETSPMLTINLPTSDVPKLASVGPALPGIDLRVVPVEISEEDTDSDQTAEESEVQARGPSVFSGYRNLPEENEAAFTEDGWFRTGDLGHFDDEGYLYITGRASTLIVLEGGKKIQPDSLEETYQEHQFIREIGILYEDNQLVALIVPEIEPINRLRNGDVEQAIREAVNERTQAVASYQRISDYAITTEPLVRTNLGKIRRHVLVEKYQQAKEGITQTDTADTGPVAIEDMSEKDRELLADSAARQMWDWLANRYPDKRLSPDTSPQLDLGVDSLEWLTLTMEVKDVTGVELSDEAIKEINTVRDLLQAVSTGVDREAPGPASLENAEEMLTEAQKKWLEPPGPALQALGAVVFFIYRLLVRLMFRLKVNGLENLPSDRNYVLTPNHSSMLDAPMVAAALTYDQMRQTHWAGAADIMLTNPLMRLVSRMSQVLPVERYTGGTGVQNLALAVAVLRRQKNLVWFPEGRITTTGEMLPFREGIGLILEQTQTVVVPVLIQGTREAMPVEASWPRLKPVTVTFGYPCDPQELAEKGEGENIPTRIVRGLQAEVAALRNER
jgi:long-chain acyl-CoA synthetase